MDNGHAFTWLSLLPLLKEVPSSLHHIVGSISILILLTVLALAGNRALKKQKDPLLPPDRVSIVGLWDVIVEKLGNLIISITGPEGKPYIPLIGTLFIYILVSNLIGIIPGSITTTTFINTNYACAITVFVYYNYLGIREHGWGYLKHFTGPILVLAPLFIIIELIGHAIRPIALSLRLFGNMTGDHIVLGVFTDMGMKIFHAAENINPVLGYVSALIPMLLPIPFFALGLFVSFIQAFVFTLLSTVYIAFAISHEH